MADLSDVPVVGTLLGAGSFLVDVVVNGGEFVLVALMWVVEAVLGHPDILLTILIQLDRLKGRVPWVPGEYVDAVLTVFLVASLVLTVLKYAEKLKQ